MSDNIEVAYDTQKGMHVWRAICLQCRHEGEWRTTPKQAERDFERHAKAHADA